MTRTEVKREAQDQLMSALQVSFVVVASVQERSERDRLRLLSEMDRQMARIEKLLGYEPGSWKRGV